MIRYLSLGAAVILTACQGSPATSDPVTAANVQTVCEWIDLAETAFQVAVPLSAGKISAADVADENKAAVAAATICTPPYPTDAPAAVAELLTILQQVQGVTPANGAPS